MTANAFAASMWTALFAPSTATPATRRCGGCAHFRNDPAFLETAFPGLSSLSSGYGAVRADDGVCLLHDRYLGADWSCGRFKPMRGEGGSASTRA